MRYAGILFSWFCLLLGCYVFLLGFFPESSRHGTEFKDIHNQRLKLKTKVPKLVFVVIDALRWDFIDKMPFLSSLVANGEGVRYLVQAETPTVTLPRLKSLMTGVIPEYLDVLENYSGGAGLRQRSWPALAAESGLNIVFYGDDTWLKMLTDHSSIFVRSEGVSSFFVNDYSQVDANVTANVLEELSRPKQWSVMVVHYLGVDHIGHVLGADSSLITSKLAELDGVLRRVYLSINSDPNDGGVLVVCGDHGMTASGGHGGASYDETHVPLGFYSRLYLSDNNANRSDNAAVAVRQEDIAATVSALLSHTPPADSVGRVLPDAVRPLHPHLAALLLNAEQLLRLCRRRKLFSIFEEVKVLLSDIVVSANVSDMLSFGVNSLHNHNSSASGGYVNNQITERKLIDAILIMQRSLTSTGRSDDPVSMAAGIATVILTLVNMSAFWTITNDSVFVAAPRKLLFWLFCVAFCVFATLLLCQTHSCRFCSLQNWRITGVFVVSFSFLLASAICRPADSTQIIRLGGMTVLSAALAGSWLLQLLTLFSSSFIEEEHQSWNQLLAALWLFLLYLSYGRQSDRVSRCCQFQQQHGLCAIFVSLSTITAFLRRWNRAGDKWRHLAATRDIVSHTPWLASVVWITSLFLLPLLCLLHDYVGRGKFGTALAVRKTAVISAFWPAILFALRSLWQQSVCIKCMLVTSVVIHCVNSRRADTAAWLWLGVALCRWDNLASWSAVLLQFELVRYWLLKWPPSSLQNRPLQMALVFHCVGAAGFFFMGNSNSPSTVDIASGYVFAEHTCWLIAALLTMCHLFLAPVAAVLYALDTAESLGCWNSVLAWLCVIRCVSVLVNMIVASCFVHHLFVWSVFTPKLLYECLATLLFVATCFSALLFRILRKLLNSRGKYSGLLP